MHVHFNSVCLSFSDSGRDIRSLWPSGWSSKKKNKPKKTPALRCTDIIMVAYTYTWTEKNWLILVTTHLCQHKAYSSSFYTLYSGNIYCVKSSIFNEPQTTGSPPKKECAVIVLDPHAQRWGDRKGCCEDSVHTGLMLNLDLLSEIHWQRMRQWQVIPFNACSFGKYDSTTWCDSCSVHEFMYVCLILSVLTGVYKYE